MQHTTVPEVRQAVSVVLVEHGLADARAADGLHLLSSNPSHYQRVEMVTIPPVTGTRDLWSEVRRHWLDGTQRT